MTTYYERLAKDAFDAFCTASVAPLKSYQQRMREIRDEHDRAIEPYKVAVRIAEAKCKQATTELNAAAEAVAPELRKKFNDAHKGAYDVYGRRIFRQQRLRDACVQAAEDSYRDIIRKQFVDPYALGEIGIGASALFYQVQGDAQQYGAREGTLDASRNVIHKLFLESLTPDEEERDGRFRSLQQELDKAVAEGTSAQRAAHQLACAEEHQAKLALQKKQEALYGKLLQARADARVECENMLRPLQDELKQKLMVIFDLTN